MRMGSVGLSDGLMICRASDDERAPAPTAWPRINEELTEAERADLAR
jgi:hypothetical protein